MIKSLETYSPSDMQKLAKRTTIVRKEKNNVSEDYTVTKKSTAAISSNFVALHNAFNKILANSINIKALQEAQGKKGTPASKIVSVPVSANIVGAEELSGVINVLGKYFDELTKLFNASDDNKPEEQEQQVDVDVGKKRKGRRSRQRMRKGGILGMALGSFGADLDIVDSGMSDNEVSRNDTRANGNTRASRGSLIGAVGAIAVMGAGYLAAKAYSSATKESPAEKQLKAVAAKTAAVPATRVPTEISNNSYSSQFADYLSDTFENVKSYITGLAGGSIIGGGGTSGYYGDGAGSTENARIAMEYLTSSKGGEWSQAQAAGIVANLQAESGDDLDTTAFNEAGGGQGAQGIAQWRGPRLTKFTELYNKPIRNASLIEQLEYVNWELNNTEAKAGRSLRGATTAEEAANIFYKQYERPGKDDASGGKRIANARAIMEVANNPGNPNGVGLVNPVPGAVITSGFGKRTAPETKTGHGSSNHRGLDFAGVNEGTPILAAGGGTVTFTGKAGSAGNMVVIDHGGGIVTRYMHMQDGSISVRNGVQVNQEQMIGRVGSTGNSSGPHLHFEVLRNGKQENPRSYLNVVPTSSAPTVAPASATPTRASLVANANKKDQKWIDALKRNQRGNGNMLILMPSGQQAPSTRRTSVPAQAISRGKSANRNSAGDYTAYHGIK